MNHKPGNDFKKQLKWQKFRIQTYKETLQINAKKKTIEKQAKVIQVFPKRKKIATANKYMKI